MLKQTKVIVVDVTWNIVPHQMSADVKKHFAGLKFQTRNIYNGFQYFYRIIVSKSQVQFFYL